MGKLTAGGTVVLQVDYDNHSLFRSKEGKRTKGSPVRIFTNLSANSLPLPSSLGYWSVGEEKKGEREREREGRGEREGERECPTLEMEEKAFSSKHPRG